MHATTRRREQQRRTLQHHCRTMDAYAYFDLLIDSTMLDEVEALLPCHRERLFPPTETLAMFMAQALSGARSCQNAVKK